MTPIEIRERVAREVMGLRQVDRGALRVTESNPTFYVDRPVATKDGPLVVAADADGSGWLVVPAYETNWGDAGQVVEEMRKRGWRLRLIQTDNGAWFAEFAPVRLGQPYKTGVSDPVAATAISLAALAALESAK